MTETKVSVAFQTIPITSNISVKFTTPVIITKSAPMIAEIPMSNPLGCQMIKVKVMKNITIANTVVMKFHLSL